jgi:protocadherin Fat 4
VFQVTDTNDNPPIFSHGAYSFDVPENTGRGARVGAVTARDMDQGVNGQVSYSVISDWANDVFSLNPQTGMFTLTARLDYEEVRVRQAPTSCHKYGQTDWSKRTAACSATNRETWN